MFEVTFTKTFGYIGLISLDIYVIVYYQPLLLYVRTFVSISPLQAGEGLVDNRAPLQYLYWRGARSSTSPSPGSTTDRSVEVELTILYSSVI